MKLFIFTVLCVKIAYAEEECDITSHYPYNCHDDKFIAKITCKGDEPCSCEPGQGLKGSCPDIIDGVTGSTLDGSKCKAICEDFDDPAECRYFRWEKDVHCSLMSEDQCTEYLACEDPDACVSGCVAESGGTTPPKVEMCMANVRFSRDTGAVHWNCMNMYTDQYINIYEETTDAVVPIGTFCFTVRRCITFDTDQKDPGNEFYRRLVVECNNEGQWVQFGGSDNDITNATSEATPHNTLIDQTCIQLPADLELDASALNQGGVSFICTKQDEEHFVFNETHVIIKQDNLCVVLCDLHHVMTIQPKFDFNEGISKFWKYTIGRDDKGEEATAENVYCWGSP